MRLLKRLKQSLISRGVQLVDYIFHFVLIVRNGRVHCEILTMVPVEWAQVYWSLVVHSDLVHRLIVKMLAVICSPGWIPRRFELHLIWNLGLAILLSLSHPLPLNLSNLQVWLKVFSLTSTISLLSQESPCHTSARHFLNFFNFNNLSGLDKRHFYRYKSVLEVAMLAPHNSFQNRVRVLVVLGVWSDL
jgi:hypothetical protein